MPSSPTPRRPAARTAGRQTIPWPSWHPRCAGRCSPGPGLPREEGRRVLENVTLLLQAPDALSELAQLLTLSAGQPVIALIAVALALPTPVTQRLLGHTEALSDIRDRAALTDQLQRLPPELLRIGRPCLRHPSPSLPRRFRRKLSGLRKIGGNPLVAPSQLRRFAAQTAHHIDHQQHRRRRLRSSDKPVLRRPVESSLDAAIGMYDQLAGRDASAGGHPEGIEDERGGLGAVDRPADDHAREGVQHDAAVELALP